MPFRNSLLGAAYTAFLLAIATVSAAPSSSPQLASRSLTAIFDNPLDITTSSGNTDEIQVNSMLAALGSLDDQMLGMGFKLLQSEDVGQVERRTWSKATTSKRTDGPVKRDSMNIEGGSCSTACGFADADKANTDDCRVTYQALYNKATAFTLDPHVVVTAKYNACAAFFVNNSDKTLVYDHWDMGGTAQWLNGNCLIQQGATVGLCKYDSVGTGYSDGAYTSVNNPNYYTPSV